MNAQTSAFPVRHVAATVPVFFESPIDGRNREIPAPATPALTAWLADRLGADR